MKTNHIVRHGGVIVTGILVTAPYAWACPFRSHGGDRYLG